MFQLTSKSR